MAPSVVKAPPTTDDPREPAMPDPTADHEPELLTIAEAADVLRAPVATLRYWRHRNIGPRSFRLGRRVLYRRADLRTWIDAQAAKSPRR
jgi:predicted DNA-binding transcriptional regulator AlpA